MRAAAAWLRYNGLTQNFIGGCYDHLGEAFTALRHVVFLLVAASSAGAQERQSSALVDDLASLMTARQLEAVAARDPDSPDHFIAALLMPEVQLLIVSAQYPAPAELQAQLRSNSIVTSTPPCTSRPPSRPASF